MGGFGCQYRFSIFQKTRFRFSKKRIVKRNRDGENEINTNGAKVYVYAGNEVYFKEQISVKGYLSSSTNDVHFGLGEKEQIDSVKVVWLDGTKSLNTSTEINTRVTIEKENTILFSMFNFAFCV